MAKKLVFVSALFGLISVASVAYAQYGMPPTPAAAPPASPITRTVLQTENFPGDQYQTVQAYVVIAPGGNVAKHTHPGIEVGYVIDGNLDLWVEGQAVKHLKTGDSFVNPNGVPHWAKNNSDKPVKILSVYIVDKSKPLATNVP